ncbi:MAG: hypothetical protein ACI9K2_005803 [Myxococcota bacterium]|jgi:hypothetical protein
MSHLSLASVMDWWIGEAEDPDGVEEHLFSCDRCTALGEVVADLGQGVHALVAAGMLAGVITPSILRKFDATGVSTQIFRIDPGTTTDCAVARDSVAMLTELVLPSPQPEGPLTLVVPTPRGPQRIDDVPVDRRSGRVLLALSAAVVRSMPAGTLLPMRIESDGGFTEDYALNHRGELD